MRKRIPLCILLLTVCAFTCILAMADDDKETDILYCGDYAYILKDSQATIVFCNAGIADFEFPEPPSTADKSAFLHMRAESGKEDDTRRSVVIPDQLDGWPVVAIGDLAFFECLFTDVIIPDGITSIGASAFGNCYYINAITIPTSVMFIGEDAFRDSDGFELSMKLSVIEGSYAAQYAQENGIPYTFAETLGNPVDGAEAERTDAGGQWTYILKEGGATITGFAEEPSGDLVIPGELDGYPVTGIGYMAFEMCVGLTSVVIPDSVKSIGIAAFDYCEALTRVTIPDGVTVIGDSAFYYCTALTDVTIPASVTSIGDGAFMGCFSLTGVTIPDNVTSIGDEVFADCSSLAGIAIPNRVTSIGFGAFSGCTSLNSVTIPDSVTSIGSMAFAMCGGLTSATVPAGVTDIGDCAFDAPNAVFPADENDEKGEAYGSDKLVLRVEEGSIAERYAKENDIPYVLMLKATADVADESLVKQIDVFFTRSKAEIIEKLGSDYTVLPAGPEGVCDGYYYEDLGMSFAFYPDSDTLELIDCYPNFKIHGVGTGSLFSEILEALGDAEIVETWLELPIYTAFMVQYHLGNAEYSFIAFEKDAPVHILWISQMPNPDYDGE